MPPAFRDVRGPVLASLAPALLSSCFVWLSAGSVAAQTRGRAPAAAVVDPYLSASRVSASKLEPFIAGIQKMVDRREAEPREARAFFERLLDVDKGNPIARRYLVELALADGDWERARDVAGRAKAPQEPREPVPLTGWRVLGPFRFRGHRDSIAKPYDPEEKLDLDGSYRGDGTICRWRIAEGPRIDYREVLEWDGAAVAYAHCEFSSKRAGWVRIGFASADGMKAWLNDREILERPGRRDIREDDDLVWAWVGRGKNRLLVKVASDGGAFRHYVQIWDEIAPPAEEFLDAAIAGRLALDKGDLDGARQRFLVAEGLSPGDAGVAVGLGTVALRQGNLVAARSWVTRALSTQPGRADALVIYADTLFGMDRPLQAFDALRAAFAATAQTDDALLERWIDRARSYRSGLQEGLARLDRARGHRAAGDAAKAKATADEAEPLLRTTFVGLADLREYHRASEPARSVELGLAGLAMLTPEQISSHCSREWLTALADDARRARPGDREALERLDRLVGQASSGTDPSVGALLAKLERASEGELVALCETLEGELRRAPEKDAYKAYADFLRRSGLHHKLVVISREGLAAGVVSRKLLLWQAESLVELARYDEARDAYTELAKDADYAERAKAGLELVRKLGRVE